MHGTNTSYLRIVTDNSGRPWFEWIEDENEYEEAVDKRLREVREVEAVVNADRMRDKWEADEWATVNKMIEECRAKKGEEAAQDLHAAELDRIEKERHNSKK